ncbi:B3 domain-containing transcription factor VRN1 [Trifolium repens]|nr:B3 domain-containing transcription factor VRN1 [Trifolium repens]
MASEIPEMKPIHFFKIIFTQNLHHGKLMMPIKFVKKYGESLPNVIYLKTPNGAKWKLNLVKSDGKIWFEKGWKEFAKYHSLAHGHLLLFKYQTTSHFQVQIFENSALEINYPFQGNKPPSGENCRAPQKRKTNSSFEFLQQCKIGKSQKVVVHHIDKECKGKQVITTAVERAKSFKTYNPSFVLAMGASYVDHRFLLTIPSKFGKTHFDLKKKRGEIYFQLLNRRVANSSMGDCHRRVWPARYTIRRCSTGLKFELTSGWKKFAKDNNLKVGDACNFELIHWRS